jgi:predicted nucleotidyltransferase
MPSLEWAVLEVLAGTQSGMGASQIARLSAEGSRSGQGFVLDRLVRQGLVIAEPANQGFLYRLNRDHLLAQAVLDAAATRARLLSLLTREARSLDPFPVYAAVFGSFARGEAGDESDIDILLIAATEDGAAAWKSAVDLIEDRVRLWTGNRCSCMVFGLDRVRELVASSEPIVKNWAVDEVVLVGGPLMRIVGKQVAPASGSRGGAV